MQSRNCPAMQLTLFSLPKHIHDYSEPRFWLNSPSVKTPDKTSTSVPDQVMIAWKSTNSSSIVATAWQFHSLLLSAFVSCSHLWSAHSPLFSARGNFGDATSHPFSPKPLFVFLSDCFFCGWFLKSSLVQLSSVLVVLAACFLSDWINWFWSISLAKRSLRKTTKNSSSFLFVYIIFSTDELFRLTKSPCIRSTRLTTLINSKQKLLLR